MKLRTTLAPLLFLAALPLAAVSAENEAADSSANEQIAANPMNRGSSDERSSPMSGQGGTTGMSQSPGSSGDSNMFHELDTNRDGFISKEEARRSADVSARFNDLDTDKDNRISAAEFRKGSQPARQ